MEAEFFCTGNRWTDINGMQSYLFNNFSKDFCGDEFFIRFNNPRGLVHTVYWSSDAFINGQIISYLNMCYFACVPSALPLLYPRYRAPSVEKGRGLHAASIYKEINIYNRIPKRRSQVTTPGVGGEVNR